MTATLPTEIASEITNTQTIAAASVAYRPTGAARTSSARSVSSSARVWRTSMKTHISAIAT